LQYSFFQKESQMNVSEPWPQRRRTRGELVTTTTLGELRHIHAPGVSLGVYARELGPSLVEATDAFIESTLHIDARVATDDDVFRLHERFAVAPGARPLLDDAVMFALWFKDLSSVQTVRFKLERVVGDECRAFHCDRNALRLISTYRGPTTEVALNDNVVRSALGQAGRESFDITNARVVKRAHDVFRLPVGAVAVMKGDAYPGNEGRGLVHRSPPLTGSGLVRVRLVVDPV